MILFKQFEPGQSTNQTSKTAIEYQKQPNFGKHETLKEDQHSFYKKNLSNCVDDFKEEDFNFSKNNGNRDTFWE